MKILVVGRRDIAKSEQIIQALQKLDFKVNYLLLPNFHYSGTARPDYVTDKGNIKVYKAKTQVGYYLYHMYAVIKHLDKKSQYDVILGIDWYESFILCIYKKLFRTRAKLIYYAYDYYFYTKKLSTRYIINRIDQFVSKRVDEVWNVNAKIGQLRSQYSPNSSNWAPQKTVELGIKDEKLDYTINQNHHYLFMGKFRPGHNLLKLVTLFGELHTQNPDYKLTMIGEGNLKEEIEHYIENHAIKNINLPGFVSMEDLKEQIQKGMYAAGIALYEDIPEAACVDPGKIKDYLALYLPVITTKATVMSDRIEQYKLGVVAQNTDIESLQDLIKHITVENLQGYQKNIKNYIKDKSFEDILKANL